jgi:EpsI family protein
VVEACGGIRYLLSSIFIGAVFAYLTFTQTHKRVLFMVWSVVMPLLANWLRAYVIVMVAHHSNNEWGMGVSHLALGWIIFGIAVFVGFAVGARWRDPQPEVPRGGPAMAGSSLAVMLAASVLAAAIPPGIARSAEALTARTSSTETPQLRFDSLSDLERDSSDADGIRPSFPGARAVHQARYKTRNGETVDVFIAYFRQQEQGAELINVSNMVEPSHDWSWSTSSTVRRDSATVPQARLEGYVKGGRHAAVYQVYWVNGTTTPSDAVAKLNEALSRLRGRGDDSAAIILTMYSQDNLEAARLKTEAFAAERLDGVLADLQRTAEGGK